MHVIATKDPYPLLDATSCFSARSPGDGFRKGFRSPIFRKIGVESWDPIEDDTSIAVSVKGKGLVVLSGCAHAGIINTVHRARAVSGVDRVHAVMGGFHLSGPLFEPIIDRTAEELKRIAPDYVIPTHCTGRKAIMTIEREMADKFLLNMAGTTLTFAA